MKIKRAIVLCIALIMMLALSGCGVPASALTGLRSALQARMDANIAIADQLYASGLIPQESRDSLVAGIQEECNGLIKDLKLDTDSSASAASLKEMAKAIVGWNYVIAVPPLKQSDIKEEYLTNYIADVESGYASYFPILNDTKKDDIVPIQIVSPTSTDLVDRLGYTVYVLNENADLEAVSKNLKNVDLTKKDTYAWLNTYFHAVKDKNGKEVRLIDTSKKENQIIGASSGSSLAQEQFDSNGKTTNKHKAVVKVGKKGSGGVSGGVNEPGIDLSVLQNDEYTIAIRFIEFNKKAFDVINSKIGLSDEAYLIVPGNNAAYLMQYPVGYVSGYEVNGTNYEAKIEKSKLVVNIKTGDIGKVSGDTNDLSAKMTSKIDQYYTLVLDQPGTSSFTVYGETGIGTGSDCWNLEYGEPATKVSIPRIVLIDYLEASFSPGVVDNTNMVCYGRKIRLDITTAFSGSIANSRPAIGWYCNFNGVNPEDKSDANWIYLDDICDIKCMDYPTNASSSISQGTKPYIKYLPGTGIETVATEQDENDLISKIENDTGYNPEKLSELEFIIRDSIECSAEFPGAQLNPNDMDNKPQSSGTSNTDIFSSYASDRPLFYAMALRKNFSESGLIKYITSENSIDSTTWWNSWLKEHAYSYNIPTEATLEYFKNNYSFELNEAGIININLETIAKIQKEYSEADKLSTTHNIRSFFKLLGYALICYGLLMLLCWTADVSVDLGFNLLEKITFGKFIAVSSEEEIPKTSSLPVSYVGFGTVLMSSLKIIALGIVLVFVDFVQITIIMIDYIGRIATFFSNIIGGK